MPLPPRSRRYRKKAPAYKKRGGLRKRAAIKRAGGRRRYGQRIMRYNTMAGLLTNSIWSTKSRALPFRVRAMKAVAAPDIYHRNYSTILQCDAGLQKFVSFGSLNQFQLGEILATVPHTNGPNRCVLENAQTEVTFTNLTNAAAEVMVYDVIMKRDVSADEEFVTTTGTYQWDTIESAITAGAQAAAGIAPAGSDPSEYIGASPFDSQVFKSRFTVAKRAHVMLASGASHRHQQMVSLNKVLDQTVVDTNGGVYLKGVSYATLLLVRGVGAYAPDAPPAGDGTTNSLFLSVVTSLRCKYSYVQDVTNTVHYHNAPLPTGTTNTRNIGSGAYEAVAP